LCENLRDQGKRKIAPLLGHGMKPFREFSDVGFWWDTKKIPTVVSETKRSTSLRVKYQPCRSLDSQFTFTFLTMPIPTSLKPAQTTLFGVWHEISLLNVLHCWCSWVTKSTVLRTIHNMLPKYEYNKLRSMFNA